MGVMSRRQLGQTRLNDRDRMPWPQKQHTTVRTCQAGRLVGAIVLLVGRLASVVKQAEAGVPRPLGKLRGAGMAGAKGGSGRE